MPGAKISDSQDFQNQLSPTYSECDENDLELCIRNSQEETMDKLPENSPELKAALLLSGKANWPLKMEQTLIQLMQAKKVEYNMKSTKFKKVRWLEIEKEFNQIMGTFYSYKQMKVKAERWAREWRIWKKIKEHTGVGWDEERKMFIYGDWVALDKVIPGAKKLSKISCPFIQEFIDLFSGSVASCKYGETSRKYSVQDSDEDNVGGGCEDAVSLGDDDDDTLTAGKSASKRSVQSGQSSQGKGESRATKKSKRETSTLADILNLINTVQQIRINKYRKEPGEEAAQILRDMNLDDELFFKAFAWITDSKHKCTTFLGLSDDLRRKWIQSLP